jgi:hypothetical protein
MHSSRVYVISRADQITALTSPARQEILDVLSRMGKVSLAELATVLGRPADGLYYHVRLLKRVGLIVHAGTRRRAGREEVLVRTIAREFAIRYAHEPRRSTRAVTAIVTSMMRLGIRDFRRSLLETDCRVAGPRRELWALRATGWLSGRQIAGVNRQMHALRNSVSAPRSKGRLYAVTILLTPLDRPSRGGGPHTARARQALGAKPR